MARGFGSGELGTTRVQQTILDGMIHGCDCWNHSEGMVVVLGVSLSRVEVGILADIVLS